MPSHYSASLRWCYAAQALALVPETLYVTVLVAHTGICREEHAVKYISYIVQTMLVETDRRTPWRAPLMAQLIQWLGPAGVAMWMRPGGSVRLDWLSIHTEVLYGFRSTFVSACML